MTFIDNIKNLEQVKKEDSLNYKKQKEDISKIMSNISKVVVYADVINSYFGEITSAFLTSSDYSIFNCIKFDDEIDYISDNEDIISLTYNNKKQIYMVKFISGNKKFESYIKAKENEIIVSSNETLIDGTVITKKKLYEKNNGIYYQKYYIEKIDFKEDGLDTVNNTYYVIKDGTIIKNNKIIVSKNNKIISNKETSRELEKKEYQLNNNCFEILYPINGIKKIL